MYLFLSVMAALSFTIGGVFMNHSAGLTRLAPSLLVYLFFAAGASLQTLAMRTAGLYGYSMVQLIETSLVSAHFAEDSNTVYLDLFSCKWYDAEAAAEFAKEFFRAERIRVQTCLRQ